MFSPDLIAAAGVSKAWPFQEAQRLAKRFPSGKGAPVLFETGYGPSGLPHIGTFQEVLRTTLVRRAYEIVASEGGAPAATRLVAFSDDMDGLRKVPDNVANRAVLDANLHKPLSRIPDPFGTHESFAAHNNARLCAFLNQFGFDYEFVSSSDCYNSGQFDDALRQVLRKYDAIQAIMLPTLRAERQATYSPILPVSPATGHVLQVPVEVLDAEAGMVRFEDQGAVIEHCIFGGQAKLQWKVDWAMRWYALGVDYEMCGKDLTDSVTQSGRIVQVLGGRKPEGMIYELFLDANGEKISKSRGNGLTIEQWLTYGSEESLGHYLYANPKSAKQLSVSVIPRAVDEYWQFRAAIPGQEVDKQLGNPAWHLLRAARDHAATGALTGQIGTVAGSAAHVAIHASTGALTGPGSTVAGSAARSSAGAHEATGVLAGPGGDGSGEGDTLPVTYGLLLNLVGVLGAGATREQVWNYLANYVENADPAAHPALDVLVDRALAYNRDFVAPTLQRRAPLANEAAALRALDALLAQVDPGTSAEDLQTIVYEVGKDEAFAFESLRDWFKALYETLLGSAQGPRMGSFIALYGVANTRALIAEALGQE